MGGHGERRIAERMERPEIDRIELRRRHVDAGQRQMAVGLGPAVARHMLDHRQHAAGQAPFHDRPSQRDDDVGIGAVGAVADDLVRPLLRHVEHRHGVDVDAKVVKLLRGQPGSGEGSLLPRLAIGLIDASIAARRRHVAPVRRLQALHPAALLIDQHQHLAAAERILELVDKGAKLRRRVAIAGEENKAARPRGGKETPLVVAERSARAA